MSSPIAIPRATNSRVSTHGHVDDADMWHSVTARSLPTSTSRPRDSGLYVPIHRRGASLSTSLPESAPLSAKRLARAVSPASSTNRYDPLASATIPSATTPIPHTTTSHITYSFAALLGLASSPAIGLSPSQRSIVDSHIPFMIPRSRSSAPRPSKKILAAPTAAANVPVADAASSAPQKKTDAHSPRRRRTGRKPSSAKVRVPAAVAGADVEGRRRRGARAYGAGWGWSATAAQQVAGQRVDFGRIPMEGETWRAERMVAATA